MGISRFCLEALEESLEGGTPDIFNKVSKTTFDFTTTSGSISLWDTRRLGKFIIADKIERRDNASEVIHGALVTSTCTDTDGDDPNTRGSVTRTNEAGTPIHNRRRLQ